MNSIPGWCIAPPASACESHATRPTAAMGCCARPVISGLVTGHQPRAVGARRGADRRLSGAVSRAHRPRACRRAVSSGGARSVLARYSDSWFAAAKRRRKGEPAGFPRRKRLLVPVRFHHQTFQLDGRRVRLPVARGRPALWVRTARPIPYPADRIRAVTLVADCGQLWLAVTAAVPVHHHDLDPHQVAGVDLGIIHPYAVAAEHAALLVSGRAIRAESFLHLRDQQARQAKTARRAPKPGQHGSRRWRRYRARLRRVEARHRRRVHQAHHQAASQVVAFAVRQRIGVLVIGDPTGITTHDAGRVHNRRLRQWRRTHLVQASSDKAEQAGIDVRRVDERGTSSTCPACRRRVPKPSGRRFRCLACTVQGTATWSVLPASPPPSAAEPPAQLSPRWSSTAEPASCRHDVTAAVTCTISGGGGPAWPQATQRAQGLFGVSLAARNHRPCVRRGSSNQAQHGQRCLKGH